MTIVRLASIVAKREGKKHEASIADIREILRILVDLEVETWGEGMGPSDVICAIAAQRVLKQKEAQKRAKRK